MAYPPCSINSACAWMLAGVIIKFSLTFWKEIYCQCSLESYFLHYLQKKGKKKEVTSDRLSQLKVAKISVNWKNPSNRRFLKNPNDSKKKSPLDINLIWNQDNPKIHWTKPEQSKIQDILYLDNLKLDMIKPWMIQKIYVNPIQELSEILSNLIRIFRNLNMTWTQRCSSQHIKNSK